MEISVIILTFNSSEFVENLLASLTNKYRKQIDEQKMEVIVADNASTDNTVDIVSRFEDVIIINSKENLGFAKGINFGTKQAKGKYLLFVNPDAEFVDGDIFDMKNIFNTDSGIGVVGGRIISANGKNELSAGKFYTPLNLLFLMLGIDDFLGVRFSSEKEKKADFVSGGFMMVSQKVFNSLGGFDESLFMYVEDMELCYRIKQKGYKVLFSSCATLKHKGQGSSNRAFAVINIYKGIYYFYKKHIPSKLLYAKFILKTKAVMLVILGKLMNNKYLSDTYMQALKV